MTGAPDTSTAAGDGAGPSGGDDHDALFGDRARVADASPSSTEVDSGGEPITVRELTVADTGDLAAECGAIVDAIVDAADEAGRLDMGSVLHILRVQQREAWERIVARACGRDTEWLGALPARVGGRVEMAFWETNRDFFGVEFALAGMVRLRVQQAITPRQPKSGSSSSPPASDATTTKSPDA